MNKKEFNQLVEKRIKLIRQMLNDKGTEYSPDDDRLHNFQVAAKIENTTTAEALWNMSMKHLVSIIDIVTANAIGESFKNGVVSEKIGDMINYLIILEIILNKENYD